MNRRDFLKFFGVAPMAITLNPSSLFNIPFCSSPQKLPPKANDSILSGIADLDRIKNGFNPGELTVVAGRPSMGKTAFALNLVNRIGLEQGKRIAYFSLENSKDSLRSRLLGVSSDFPHSEFRFEKNRAELWSLKFGSQQEMSHPNLFIDDRKSVTSDDIRETVRIQPKFDLIIVDYFQLMKPLEQFKSRNEEAKSILRDLKALASSIEVPVIVLVQLNRGLDHERPDRRPKLEDMRVISDHSAIDNAILLYRPSYYNTENPFDNCIEFHVVRNANGKTGVGVGKFNRSSHVVT